MATMSHVYVWPFLEQAVVSVAPRASVEEVSVGWRSPTSARWSGKIPEPDLNHSVFDRVKSLHRRETTQFPEVLLWIILKLKGQFNKSRGISPSSLHLRFQSFHAARASQSFVRSPRQLSLSVPLPFDCSRHRQPSCMTSGRWSRKFTASHWCFVNGGGLAWHG